MGLFTNHRYHSSWELRFHLPERGAFMFKCLSTMPVACKLLIQLSLPKKKKKKEKKTCDSSTPLLEFPGLFICVGHRGPSTRLEEPGLQIRSSQRTISKEILDQEN